MSPTSPEEHLCSSGDDQIQYVPKDETAGFLLHHHSSVYRRLDISSECLSLSCLVVGHLEPITLFNQAGIHVSLHFAKDSPTGHPGVAVVVISAVNTSALHVKDFLFQAAVPKVVNSKHTFRIRKISYSVRVVFFK